MHNIEKFKFFEENKSELNIFFHKESQCLRIDNYYLFLNEQKLVTESDLVKEGFSDYLPLTTSAWIHLGVDTVSAIVDLIPGIGNAISFVIDILHTLAYFVEAYYDEKNRFSLTMGGIITGIFATIPGVGNIGSLALKSTIRAAKTGGGGIFKGIVKSSLIPVSMKGRILKKLFNIGSIKTWIVKGLDKHSDSWWFKLMNKIPIINKMTKFVTNNLDTVLKQGDEYIKQNFKLYQKTAAKEAKEACLTHYKTMSRRFRKAIPEDDFLKISNKKIQKNLPKQADVAAGNIPKDFTKLGTQSAKQTKQVYDFYKTKADAFFNSQFKSSFLKSMYKAGYKKAINKEIVKAMTTGSKINYKHVVSTLIKRTPKSLLKQIPKQVLKKGAPILLKNTLFKLEDGEVDPEAEKTMVVDDTEDKNTVLTAKAEKEAEKEADEFVNFKDKWELYESHLLSVDGLGITTLVFHTPDKDGEEGRLMFEGGVFKVQDFSSRMKLYNDDEELFNDLVKVGKKKEKKKESKRKVRKGELNKWEKTPLISTPYIEELDDQRFEIDFLVRERSKISLHKKSHIEKIDWSEVFNSDFLETGSYKLNSSLYITLERKIKE
jgi:hypothetical protein